jgi:hypothetical protein
MNPFILSDVIVVILAIVGLGWKTFSSGVIIGFDKAVDIGTPVIKNLTQEAAKEYVNKSSLMVNFPGLNMFD